jgi:Domain of unknown function (DUF5666)
MKNKQLLWIAAIGIVAGAAISAPVFAQTVGASVGASVGAGVNPGGPMQPVGRFGGGMHGGQGLMGPGIVGMVTGVNGTSLTVASRMMLTTGNPNTGTNTGSKTVYTVDASNAKVMKNGTSTTVSAIAVGDMVMVRGTVTGTNVMATAIRDGVMPGRFGGRGPGGNGTSTASSTFPITGNGEPVIAGNIVSISGTTLTVTNASNVTYTIDASNATIVKDGTTSTISNISTGDKVIVQGTVNGTSITASSVIDQGSGTNSGSGAGGSSAGGHMGILSTIGNFFKRIFGF